MVRDTYLRSITEKERNTLHLLITEDDPAESGYRAKIILLKDDGYTVPEIRKITKIIMIIILENGFIDSMKKV